jgi:hypothetical protein
LSRLLRIAVAPAVLLTVRVPSAATEQTVVIAGVAPRAVVALLVPEGALDVAGCHLLTLGDEGVGGSGRGGSLSGSADDAGVDEAKKEEDCDGQRSHGDGGGGGLTESDELHDDRCLLR